MRPAFSSRTKRRGATTLAPALRLFFLTASDMWHPYGDLTRNWSALDRNCAANTCHDIEWDDRRWNGCASSSLSYGVAYPLPRTSVSGTFDPTADVGCFSRIFGLDGRESYREPRLELLCWPHRLS